MCAITNSLTDGRAGGRRCSCVWGLDCAAGSVPSKAQHTQTAQSRNKQERALQLLLALNRTVCALVARRRAVGPRMISAACVRVCSELSLSKQIDNTLVTVSGDPVRPCVNSPSAYEVK